MANIYVLKATLTDWEARVRGQPYRVLAVRETSSLYDLALAINQAFGFDFDHAFGFFDNLKNPYGAKERYELFADLEEDLEDLDEDELEQTIGAALDEALEEELGMLSEEERQELETTFKEMRNLIEGMDPEEARGVLVDNLLQDVPEEDREEVRALLADVFTLTDMGDEEDEPESRSVKGTPVSEAFVKGKKLLYLFDYGDEWRFIVQCQRIEEAEPKKRYPKVLEAKGDAPEQYGEWEEDEGDWEE